MGFNEDFGRTCDQIIDRVTDAVKNGNYSNLSSDITDTVKRNMSSSAYRPYRQPQTANPYIRNNTMQQVNESKLHSTPFMTRPADTSALSATAGLLLGFTVVNFIVVAVFIILALVSGMVPFLGGGLRILFIVAACVFGGLGGVFIHFLRKTNRQKQARLIFNRYRQILGNSEYASIDDISARAGEPHEKVIEDLKTMMGADLLPGASVDPEETTLILSQYARGQYKALLFNQSQKAEAEKGLPEEAVELLRQGDQYIARIHRANDLIPEEGMSEKLDDLEDIMKKIFAEVRRSPEKRDDLRRLMDYYLPTTMKLVDAYSQMETRPQTDNISSTKQEIENSLDVINEACRKLFDTMFEEESWDISSDINVMKTMMKQDGLVDDGAFDTDNK
ncbi:5-bromo-4-chloroindolyl phosphate hydrolysis family protein [Candidatus Weimeria sp. HCP3S3_B5]|uniref:5-bromo-4-chloroindolyl phosphate hydrolysis family protein n=1 Tax=Candidatus Weimeria sp. HCP3S3_B5 TaxID=3438871 RepID=UPI00302A7D42|nr:5-bromo-4-chloroindolyl phosphate hydrolysis family protein [Lachnospiraceae bacterium]